ncbi:MAG: tRNA (adenosine(37)-N6)-threonylcarbamoyltransferase complex dimerization subunit type 1 TsaB [Candidatus Omnitrophica bacterium]|nr:tRNA (adenosine(37)-N6)-threonylcarbamoyltransferase complex dimerization subunit type 1 TsaB [Candidatus Omnitrophota bacterium]
MNILAIESSSQILSVALSCKGSLRCQFRSSRQFKSEHITGLIKKSLDESGLKICQLDYIAVGLGPGSFTGLRVGIATALGLAQGAGLEIIGIGSLDLIAANVSGVGNSDICAIVDARRDNLYAAIYQRPKHKKRLALRKKMDYSLLKSEELLKKINSPTIFVGDGLENFKEKLGKKKSRIASFASKNLWFPRASVLCNLALESLKNKRNINRDRNKLLPIYLYPKECQIRNAKEKK